jgi:preprotein translocase subunit SecG
MLGFFLGLGILLLVLVSLFLIFIVLMQRSGSSSGMGAAMGGGAAEAAFGGGTSNVLSRATIQAAVVFLVLTFALYLGFMYKYEPATQPQVKSLPELDAIVNGVGLTQSAEQSAETTTLDTKVVTPNQASPS